MAGEFKRLLAPSASTTADTDDVTLADVHQVLGAVRRLAAELADKAWAELDIAVCRRLWHRQNLVRASISTAEDYMDCGRLAEARKGLQKVINKASMA